MAQTRNRPSAPRVIRQALRHLVLACALLALLPAASLASYEALPLDAFVTEAAVVVDARVLSVESAEHGAKIVTTVRLAVDRTITGEAPGTLEVEYEGGRVGDRLVWVTGSPQFAIGERTLVFLADDGSVLGGDRGAHTVLGDQVPSLAASLLDVELRIRGLEKTATLIRLDAATSDEPDLIADAGAPTIYAISPGKASAGTGEVVTVTGRNFGSAPGRFLFAYRGPGIDGRIVSWSDTRIRVEVPIDFVFGYPASACSGPARVITAADVASAGYPFEVSFGYGGFDWDEPLQGYYIKANAPSLSNEAALVRAAANTLSQASNFALTYRGTTAYPGPNNGRNEVSWGDVPFGALGQARLEASLETGRLMEADIVLGGGVAWGDGTDSYDVQSITLHEFGHWLCLRDLYGEGDAAKVMYGVGRFGVRKRVLHADDTAGAQWIYGGYTGAPPVTSISGLPGGWVTGDVTVSLSATDPDSAVASTRYRVGDGPEQVYTAPFTISTEGAMRIAYWSVDVDGNIEVPRVALARIDRSPPVTRDNARAVYYGSASVKLTASDEGSGVTATYASLDGAPYEQKTRVTTSALGTHTLTYWSVDALGHRETTRSASFELKPPPDIAFRRLAGPDRYRTALAVSRASFPAGGTDVVVLVTGDGYADALSASALAGCYDAPLLLTRRDRLEAGVLDEVGRLGAGQVVCVGGPGVIAESVVADLRRAGLAVSRIAGTNRYETAAAVARRVASLEGLGFAGEAFLTRGDGFADAIAAAPYAFAQRLPILLVEPHSMPASTRRAIEDLGITRFYVLGGPNAVADSVIPKSNGAGNDGGGGNGNGGGNGGGNGNGNDKDKTNNGRGNDLTAAAGKPAYNYQRLSGSDRYRTAHEIAEHALAEGWATARVVGIATGYAFPDALGGGAAVGSYGGILLLSPGDRLDTPTEELLYARTDDIEVVWLLGGERAVSSRALARLERLWGLDG